MNPDGGDSDYERTASDLALEQAIIVEYGQALASAAESCLRYPDRLSLARSEDDREHIRREHGRFLRRIIDANEFALSVLDPVNPTKGNLMKWLTWNNISKAVIGAAATIATLSGAGIVAIPAVIVKVALGVGIVAAKYLPGHGDNKPAPDPTKP